MRTGDSIKYIALKSLGYDDPLCAPTNRCWACEYAINKAIYLHKCNEDMCHFCPIKWKTTQCHYEGGEYKIWIRHLVVGEFEDAERRKSWMNCHNCLFDWYHHDEPWDAEWSNYCDDGMTLYSRFHTLRNTNKDWKEAARIAREIANMPVREDV